MEQILFLLLVAIVGAIRWFLGSLEEKRNREAAKRGEPPASNAPVPRAPAQTEEERIRRFMEALGVPTTTTPPPLPKRERREVTPKKPREPKRKVQPVDPFPGTRPSTWTPEPVVVVQPTAPPVVMATPPPLPLIPPTIAEAEGPVTTWQQRTAPVFEVVVDSSREVAVTPTGMTDTGGVVRPGIVTVPQSWSARLRSASNVRDAVVLREIFGPPRSMQTPQERAFI